MKTKTNLIICVNKDVPNLVQLKLVMFIQISFNLIDRIHQTLNTMSKSQSVRDLLSLIPEILLIVSATLFNYHIMFIDL